MVKIMNTSHVESRLDSGFIACKCNNRLFGMKQSGQHRESIQDHRLLSGLNSGLIEIFVSWSVDSFLYPFLKKENLSSSW